MFASVAEAIAEWARTRGSGSRVNSHQAIRVSSGEMEILAMLWQHEPMTLQQAFEAFREFGKSIAYRQ